MVRSFQAHISALVYQSLVQTFKMSFWNKMAMVWAICLIPGWNCKPLPSENMMNFIKQSKNKLQDANLDTSFSSKKRPYIGHNVDMKIHENEVKENLIWGPTHQGHLILQRNDWYSLLQSISLLEKEISEIELEMKRENLITIRKSIEELRKCLKYSLKFEGLSSNSVFISKTEELRYNNSIIKLIKLIHAPKSLIDDYHYIEMFKNDCILKMIYHLKKYSLMPVDTKKRIEDLLKDPFVLQSMAQEIYFCFMNNSLFDNEFHYPFASSIFLANHFHLSNYNKFFEELNKYQQDIVLFHLLKLTFFNTFSEEVYLEEKTSSLVEVALPKQLLFFKKTEEFLLNNLKKKNSIEDSIIFLESIKDEIVGMRSILTDMRLPAEYKEKNEYMKAYILQSLIFLERNFGHEAISKIGWEDQPSQSKFKFNEIYKLSKSVEEALEWIYILFDFSNFISVRRGTIFDVENDSWKERREFYFNKVHDSLENLANISKKLHFIEIMNNNDIYQRITKPLHKNIKDLGKVYKCFGENPEKEIEGGNLKA